MTGNSNASATSNRVDTFCFASRLFVVLLLWSLSLSALANDKTPGETFDRVSIGAFDPDAWNGIVFDSVASGFDLPFAIRIGSKANTFLDGERIFNAVSLVGPHAPDGSYALMGWHHEPRTANITLEWSRIDETTVIGRLKAPADIPLVVEAYSPYQSYFTGSYHLSSDKSRILGEHRIENNFHSAVHFLVATDRPVSGSATFQDIVQLRQIMDAGQLANAGMQTKADDQFSSGAAGIQFVTGEGSTAHFVASIGWNAAALSANATRLLTAGEIDRILDQKAAHYEENRPHIQGLFSGAPEAIGNSMFWNTQYVPKLNIEFPTISRNWSKGFGGWVTGEWDCFFGSLLTNVEDTAQTSASTRAILLSQEPNGVVPNVDGASGTSPDRTEPPVGSFVVWKNYERNQDRQILEWAYPRLKQWHEWWFRDRGDGQPWRDGNRDGLLEWGSDKGSSFSVGGRGSLEQAKWESGMDDSPMWDGVTYDPQRYTLDLDDVGLNSLYALDSECLAKIAAILGYEEDSRSFQADYSRMKNAVQDRLWNEQDGMFENRFWDGRFSRNISPTNFYPMLAGIASQQQAQRMVKEHLLNPQEFWGKYVIPTIARNNPAFKDQYYWRGDIWGPTNYLVYEGIDRYHFDEVALEFAAKSYDLFMDDWHAHQHTNEQYYAWGGSAGGDKHYTWGALLCLMPMDQYIDQTPWDGLRFGALSPPEAGEVSNITWGQHRYKVAVGPDKTTITRDGTLRFEASGGVVVRGYAWSPNRLTFSIRTERPVNVQTREYSGSSLSLQIDGEHARAVPVQQGNASFLISAGEHTVVETFAQ